MDKIEEKIVLSNEFEEILEKDKRYFIRSKKDRVCVLPYTISSDGLLDKIGIINIENKEERKVNKTLLNDYLNEDDPTDLVGANRIFYEVTNSNLVDASKWMFLGNLSYGLLSESAIKIYAVDISGIDINNKEEVIDENMKKIFKMVEVSEVLQTDDLLFLGSFSRLFNFFYTNALK